MITRVKGQLCYTKAMRTNPKIAYQLSTFALAELDRRHKAALAKWDDALLYTNFVDALESATLRVHRETDTTLVTTLVGYWLDCFRIRVQAKLPSGSKTLTNMRVFCKMVVDHNIVGTVIQSAENRRILGWLCSSRVIEYERGIFRYAMDDIHALFKIWFGDKAMRAKPSVAASVDLLYGPGVWDLYAADVELTMVPNHLYSLGLPVLGPESQVTRVDSKHTIDLPNSF